MSNADVMAFPELSRSVTGLGSDGQQHSDHYSMGGLTKRELFSAMAMQGLLASPDLAAAATKSAKQVWHSPVLEVAGAAVDFADALLAALEPAPAGYGGGE